MGVPAILIVAAPNQSAAAAAAGRRGIAVPLGRLDKLAAEDVSRAVGALARDPVQRARMSEAGQKLIDGKGASRAVVAMRACVGAPAGGGR
jgi:spore coat polysaccharide biosynthesis predicted glycosyltransferase SpsG